MKIIFSLLTLLLLSSVAIGANAFMPDGRVMYQSAVSNTSYSLSLGAPEKVNGVWTIEREKKVRGDVSRKTIEVAANLAFNEAANLVTEAFNSRDSQALFYCSGLDCGSSSAWANYRLGIKQLYGLDEKQRLWVWTKQTQHTIEYITAYLVQRGNRRVYMQLDTVSSVNPLAIAPDVSVVLNDLQQRGYYELRQLSMNDNTVDIGKDELENVFRALLKRPLLSVYVVGHNYASPADQQYEKSLALSQNVVELLQQRGIKPQRLVAKGAGGLAPQGRRNALFRIQLVPKL